MPRYLAHRLRTGVLRTSESRRYLEMFYGLQYRPLAAQVSGKTK